MSATDLESSAAHGYFQAVEDIFIGLRGAPLLLSPADYQVVRGWYEAGIPLEVVREALAGVFAKRRAKGKEARGLATLRYCRPAVKKAWEEQRSLAASGHREAGAAEPLEVGERLAALARALPPDLPLRPAWEERIGAIAGSPEEVEGALTRLDDELMAALEREQDGASKAALDAGVEKALARVAGRLPAAELAASRKRLARQLLRQRWGLPVLSLFAPEAEAAAPGAGAERE